MALPYSKCPSCGRPFADCPCSLSKAKLADNYKLMKKQNGAFPVVPSDSVLFMCPVCFATVPEGFIVQHKRTHS